MKAQTASSGRHVLPTLQVGYYFPPLSRMNPPERVPSPLVHSARFLVFLLRPKRHDAIAVHFGAGEVSTAYRAPPI